MTPQDKQTPSYLHFGGMALVALGVILEVADKAESIPGNVGTYAGIVAQIAGLILHLVNTPNAITPPSQAK